jgi:AcrR family transcriptional regulator
MAGRSVVDLGVDEIVDAALAILDDQGLSAVSMRNVGARLGTSPVPLYNRIGNKEALLAAMVQRLMADMAPAVEPHEHWADYAARWANAVRQRFAATAELRLVLGNPRAPFVEASRPLVAVLRDQGFEADAAVQTCRLLLWAAAGFATIEAGSLRRARSRRGGGSRSGGDPAGVTRGEAYALFELHLRYLLEGLARDHP